MMKKMMLFFLCFFLPHFLVAEQHGESKSRQGYIDFTISPLEVCGTATLGGVLGYSLIQAIRNNKLYRRIAAHKSENQLSDAEREALLKRIDFRCSTWQNASIISGVCLALWVAAFFVYDTYLFREKMLKNRSQISYWETPQAVYFNGYHRLDSGQRLGDREALHAVGNMLLHIISRVDVRMVQVSAP